jgi:tetratricopeptide (TPR) repeat protein
MLRLRESISRKFSTWQPACGSHLEGGSPCATLGHVASWEGDLVSAREMYEKAIELFRAENEWGLANALYGLARIGLAEGDRAAARRLGEEALAIYRSVGNQLSVASLIYFLGGLDLTENLLDNAKDRFREAVSISQSTADPGELVTGLLKFATVAITEHCPERALRLLGAASVYHDAHELAAYQLEPIMKKAIDDAYNLLARPLADAAFNAGQTLTLEQALDEALGTPKTSAMSAGSAPRP